MYKSTLELSYKVAKQLAERLCVLLKGMLPRHDVFSVDVLLKGMLPRHDVFSVDVLLVKS